MPGSCPIRLIWWQQAFVCVSPPKPYHTETNFPISVVEKGIWTALLHVGGYLHFTFCFILNFLSVLDMSFRPLCALSELVDLNQMLVILIPFQLCSEIRNFEASLVISSNTCCFYDRRYISKRILAPVCVQQLNVSVNTQGQSMKRQTLKWEIYEMKSKWRALHHSTYVIALHHTLYLSFLTWFPFLSHSVFFSFHVLLSCLSLWTLERLY